MKKKIGSIIFWILFSILYLLHAVINGACDWYNMRFGVTFEEIIFTITSPLIGADVSFLNEAVEFTLPYIYEAIPLLLLMILATLIFYKIVIKFRINIAKLNFTIHLKTIYKLICLNSLFRY